MRRRDGPLVEISGVEQREVVTSHCQGRKIPGFQQKVVLYVWPPCRSVRSHLSSLICQNRFIKDRTTTTLNKCNCLNILTVLLEDLFVGETSQKIAVVPTRLGLFPFCKWSSPFLTVDCIIANQLFSHDSVIERLVNNSYFFYADFFWFKGQMNQNFDIFYFSSILVKCVQI